MDRGAWQATVHGITRVRQDLAIEQQQHSNTDRPSCVRTNTCKDFRISATAQYGGLLTLFTSDSLDTKNKHLTTDKVDVPFGVNQRFEMLLLITLPVTHPNL